MTFRANLPVAMVLGVLLGASPAQDEKPKTIKDVMVLHKDKDSFLNKILGGKGTDDDHKKLLTAYEVMAGLAAPKGDEKSWKDKTKELVAAAKDVVDKKKGGIDQLKKASDCKACHSLHKPPAPK